MNLKLSFKDRKLVDILMVLIKPLIAWILYPSIKIDGINLPEISYWNWLIITYIATAITTQSQIIYDRINDKSNF